MAKYECVIGLEVHIELRTKTKIFCDCPADHGGEPNTRCCPVCMGMPGTLPVLNKQVVDFAARAGMILNCEIAHFSKMDRKNYFYPDLPKAYQISQLDHPLCEHGYIDINVGGEEKRIGITRIHIEEDAGKLVHTDSGSGADCNRCGVPLIEIVSEPDIRSAAQAKAYLERLRELVRWVGVSDCQMETGSMRCDVNLSIRPVGDTNLYTRTEIKNLNSLKHIVAAIDAEKARQIDETEAGRELVQETRRYDPEKDKTYSMRVKENANDYRYFPDPDLVPIYLTDEDHARLRAMIPDLPEERLAKYTGEYKLPEATAKTLCDEPKLANLYQEAVQSVKQPKLLANLMLADSDAAAIPAAVWAELTNLCAENKINRSAPAKLLEAFRETGKEIAVLVKELGLEQVQDTGLLNSIADEVIAANPKAVADFKSGKQAAIQALMGQIMKRTKGAANPAEATALLKEKLSKL
ncbi:MAG: Asp-tRNA(Asn)/Glu-tRNA(Gln) amidotransferase subunit GatB [Oscillospiraceae bacterium]|nr:Asp-tRNA(Asn)/Glu-tRNA(Gln) amidotransferase subunit GatB [Oscillospiraceae bacterium]MCR4759139.1 Asp-tRNA(Asn)/Glu-tRNA(Gln) amidotransferase subunit GatB [Oscillospiraceae bacterium]